jgi:hypothetical protein
MTTTDGIEAVFLETRDWGKAAKFFQALGTREITARDPDGRVWSLQGAARPPSARAS